MRRIALISILLIYGGLCAIAGIYGGYQYGFSEGRISAGMTRPAK